MRDFKNKTVVITGAAGGFGKELTKLFCVAGAQVIGLDVNESELKRLSDTYEIETDLVDVADDSAWKTFTTKLKKKGIAPDIWINNAGLSFPKAFTQHDAPHYEKIMRVNLDGVIKGTRTALQIMKKGIIVNIASVAGFVPVPYMSAYVTSKFGVVGFTKGLQHELDFEKSKVKLLLISPGFADTKIMKTNTAEFEIPSWMQGLVSSPQKVAREILKAIQKEKPESFPALTGPIFTKIYKYGPNIAFKALSKMFVQNLKK